MLGDGQVGAGRHLCLNPLCVNLVQTAGNDAREHGDEEPSFHLAAPTGPPTGPPTESGTESGWHSGQ